MNSIPSESLLPLLAPFIFFAFFGGIFLGLFAFWIWMLIDCLKHEPSENNSQLTWTLVIIFANWIGAIIYYFIRRRERIQTANARRSD